MSAGWKVKGEREEQKVIRFTRRESTAAAAPSKHWASPKKKALDRGQKTPGTPVTTAGACYLTLNTCYVSEMKLTTCTS